MLHLTDPLNPDTDGDGMPDDYEVATPCIDALVADGGGGADGDGLTNLIEFGLGTDPCDADSKTGPRTTSRS